MPGKDKAYAVDIITRFVNQISKEYPVMSAYLFGSYCYDMQNTDSDIDMALVLNDSIEISDYI